MEHKLNEVQEKYGKASDFYNNNVTIRNSLENIWKDASQLTLPYVYPPDDTKDRGQLPSPYNSIGPAAVNTLASKLLLTLLPPTGAFFRLLPDKELTIDLNTAQKKQLDGELSQLEQDVVELINIRSLRVPVYEAIKLLIITGNVMLYKVPKGSFKVFSPYQYVVERDYVGNLLTAAIHEKIAQSTLPAKVIKQMEEYEGEGKEEVTLHEKMEEVSVYTMIVREKADSYRVWQEIEGMVVEGTNKTYTKENLPYMILRWSTTTNSNYGIGLVEQYLGDLRSLEGLTQTIVEGTGIAAKVIFGIRPGASLQVEDLNNAENGDAILGDLEREVTTLQVNKGGDLSIALQLMQILEQRLSKAFLMLGGQIRDSERTTAVEVRATAAELEATFGGVFSVLATDFQTPLVSLLVRDLSPEVLKVTTPSITTGISAISREKDFNNLNVMLQSMSQLGPDVLMKYLNIPSYLSQVAASLGISPDAIVKSNEQVQQEEQQAMQQQQAMMQQEQQAAMQQEQVKQQGKQ